MSLSIVLHPDVVSFLGDNLNSEITGNVWGCIEKMREQRFDQGLRAKKLKGISEKVWETRINKASRLIFTYKKSIQPDTGKPQTYIAVQDICLDHDDVSRRARARKVTPDSQWLDADVVEMFGDLDSETISTVEQNILNQMQSEDIHIGEDFCDELLGNIQWKVVDSEEEWRQAIIEGGKDLSLKLTQQEYELATKYGNFLVMGSAGTGKTTVGLYRMVNSLTQLGEGKRLYIAASPILVKESEKCFKRLYGKDSLGDVFEFKTIKQLCFDILRDLNSGCNYLPECEVTYHVFEKWYSEFSRYDRNVYPASLVWHEIRGIIKGASLDFVHDYLPEHKYKDLGRRRSSVITRKSDRDDIYKIAKRYKHFLEEKQLFDEIDLTRKALGVAVANRRYQMIVCDEVQDFAELQLLLLVKLITSGGQLFFTGDLNQMILPSAFRWEDLTSILSKEKISYHQPEELNTNFRSVGSLSNLSNQILKLRCDLLREQSSKGFTNVSGDFRDAARNINTPLEEISSILKDLYPDEAILVRTIEEKEQFSHLKFVFTIEESKGLEFDTVFLVEFFTPKQNLWTKLLNQQKTSSNENVELRLEFNLLYVAITRARRVLNIWEAQKAALWNREEVKPFVQSIAPESARQDRIEPTQQDWLNRGIYYRDAGFYAQAIECFEKVGDERLKLEVEVKLQLQARNYSEAAELLVHLQEWEKAAQIFEKLGFWESAADCWGQVGSLVNQNICQAKTFEKSCQWEFAALLYEELGLQEDYNRCRLNLSKKPSSSSNSDTSTPSISTEHFNANANNAVSTIDEYNSSLHFNKGLEKFNRCNYRGSIQEYDKALHLNPLNLDVYINRGNAKSKLGDYLGAIKDYDTGIIQEAIFLEPKSDTYYSRSVAKRALKMLDESFEDIDKAIELDDSIPEYYYERGQLYLEVYNQYLINNNKITDNSKAIENFQIAANLYLQQGNNQDYQDSLNKIKSIMNVDIENYTKLVNLESELLLQSEDRLPFKLADAYNELGIAYSKLEKYDEAIIHYTNAIQTNHLDDDFYNNRGIAYFRLQKYDEAIADYDKAIEINKHNIYAYHNRGNLNSELRKFKEAIIDYSVAIELDITNSSDSLYCRGFAHWCLNHEQEAKDDYDMAVWLNPQIVIPYEDVALSKGVISHQTLRLFGNNILRDWGHDT